MRNITTSLQQYDWSPQNLAWWCWMCVSSAKPIKNFILKIQNGRQPICLRDPFCIIMKYCKFVDFQAGSCPSSWNFKIEIFNSQSPQRHTLCYHVKFCGDQLNCCRDIAFFSSQSLAFATDKLSSMQMNKNTQKDNQVNSIKFTIKPCVAVSFNILTRNGWNIFKVTLE